MLYQTTPPRQQVVTPATLLDHNHDWRLATGA